MQYDLQPMDIILIRTDSDKLWPRPEYFSAHPGMTEEATQWLVEPGINVIGIDTNVFDIPFMEMVQTYLSTKNSPGLWPPHMYGRTSDYIQMDALANIDR